MRRTIGAWPAQPLPRRQGALRWTPERPRREAEEDASAGLMSLIGLKLCITGEVASHFQGGSATLKGLFVSI